MDEDIFKEESLGFKSDKKALVVVGVLILVAVAIVLPLFSGFSSISAPQSDGAARTKAQRSDFSGILSYILFFIAGYFVVLASKKYVRMSTSYLGLAFSLAGTLLIFISLLVLVWLTPFIQSMGSENFFNRLIFDWFIKFFIFIFVGVILAFTGNKLNSNKIPLSAVLSLVALPTLFLSAIGVFGLGVRDLITYKMPGWAQTPLSLEERFGWVITFILLAIITFLVLAHIKSKSTRALDSFKQSLKISGWAFAAVAFILFVIGIITFNFSSFDLEKFVTFILEPVVFGIIGAFCLLAVGKIKSKDILVN